MNAVLAAESEDVVDAVARAEAVAKVRGWADFASISVAFKRTKNILRQATENKRTIAGVVDIVSLREESEKELAVLVPQTAGVGEKLRATRHYHGSRLGIAKLRPAADRVFVEVKGMVH